MSHNSELPLSLRNSAERAAHIAQIGEELPEGLDPSTAALIRLHAERIAFDAASLTMRAIIIAGADIDPDEQETKLTLLEFERRRELKTASTPQLEGE